MEKHAAKADGEIILIAFRGLLYTSDKTNIKIAIIGRTKQRQRFR